MRGYLKKFDKSNAQILAIDPHESWSAKYLLKKAGIGIDEQTFPTLTDPSITVSAAYGVAFQMRIHVERSNRPATFIIDKEGIIQYAKRAAKFNDRPTPQEIHQVLESLEN